MSDLPLVLLPGTLCDARVWGDLLAAWGERAPRNVWTPSLTGHRSAEAMARALLQNAPPRFAVMGFSLGGIVALEMAAQAPRRIAGLGLVATNARSDPPANAARRRAGVQAARAAGLAQHVRADLWSAYVAPERRGDTRIQQLVVQMAIDSGFEAYEDQAGIASYRADSLPRLQAIDVPVLLVGGDEDTLNPRDRQAEMAERLGRSEWRQLAGVGHFVPLEAPADLARAAAAWFDDI